MSLDANNNEMGYLITMLANEKTVINWKSIGYGELRLTVWWKYNHSSYLKVNLKDNNQKKMYFNLPLVRHNKYSSFVGVIVSGWLERRSSKHLQGNGENGLFNIYTIPVSFQNVLEQPH